MRTSRFALQLEMEKLRIEHQALRRQFIMLRGLSGSPYEQWETYAEFATQLRQHCCKLRDLRQQIRASVLFR